MFYTLMTSRRFAPIFWCQLFSALNDNFVKNALVEGATFLAILIGTIAGGLAAAKDGTAPLIATAVMVLAGLAWVSAKVIPPTGAAAPGLAVTRNPLRSTAALLADLAADRRLRIGALITS